MTCALAAIVTKASAMAEMWMPPPELALRPAEAAVGLAEAAVGPAEAAVGPAEAAVGPAINAGTAPAAVKAMAAPVEAGMVAERRGVEEVVVVKADMSQKGKER